MTYTKHTPTPWYWGDKSHHGYFNLRSDSGIVIGAEENYTTPYMDISEEDAAHIVKCVNMHDELVGVVRAMANFDGRNNNYHLKQMARETLKKAGAL